MMKIPQCIYIEIINLGMKIISFHIDPFKGCEKE